MEENKTNCQNCGAPLSGGKCKYCGTEYREVRKRKYFYKGKEIENPTEEMLGDPYLLVLRQ